MAKGPVLIEMEAAPQGPDTAAPVPDLGTVPEGQAMQLAARVAARKPSWLGRLFWTALLALISFTLSVAAWTFVTDLIAQNPILGGIAAGLVGAFVLACLLLILRGWIAFARLRRLDGIHRAAEAALAA